MLRVRVLGPLEVAVGGEPASIGRRRQRAVLGILLAARGRTVPVDRIVEAVWEGSPPAKPRSSLHVYVSHLRGVLEPARLPRAGSRLLVSSPQGYALHLAADAVDAWSFEAAVGRSRSLPAEEAGPLLDGALGLWRGEAYAEWAGEPWAAAETARLNELRLMAQELSLAAALGAGRPQEAVPAAEAYVRSHPLREEGWRLLALGLWATGRQGDALAALRRAGAVCAEELGLDLGPGLVELERAILTRQLDVLAAAVPPAGAGRTAAAAAPAPAPEAPAPVPETSGTAGPAAPGAVSPSDVDAPAAGAPAASDGPAADALPVVRTEGGSRRAFVGRRHELGVLAEAARAALRGGAVALVAGEGGAGKSSLLDRCAAALRSEGWNVVVGRCPDGPGVPAAWAWVEALRDLAGATPPEHVGPLSALLDPDGVADGPRGDATAGRFRLHTAFTRWLASAAARQPLAVFIDDLHEADEETLALLGRAAAIDGVPLLVVAAYRPGHADTTLAPLMAGLARRDPYRVPLGGLGVAEVATLVRALCGTDVSEEVVTALAERTGGNPFYVGESARLLMGRDPSAAMVGVPDGIRDVVRQRLARLPAEAAAILRLAAVAGAEAHVAVLCAAAGAPAAEVVDALEVCVTAGLLTEPGPGLVRFTHPLLRDTVYSDLSGLRRGLLHGRLAGALEQLRPDALPALALHFTRSGDPAMAGRAVEFALRAAELAEHRYAHDVSADLLRQALDAAELIPEPGDARAERAVDLLGALMRAQIRAGSGDAAARTRRRALDAAQRAGRDDLAVAAFTAWTEPTPWLTRSHGTVDRHAVDTLERLTARPGPPPADLARLLQALVDELPGDAGEQARTAAERQLALARRAGDPGLLAAALTTMTKLLPHEAQAARCVPVVAELRELTARHDLPAYRWVCEQVDAMVAAIGNDVEAVERHAREGLAVARRYRMPEAEAASLSTLAMLAHAGGRFVEAEGLYGQVRERLVRHNASRAADLHARGVITIRLSQGRIAEIEPLARTLHAAWGARGGEALALVLALQGKLEEARAVRFDAVPVPDHFYGVRLGARARLACLLGDTEAAAALVPLLRPVRDQFGSAAATAFCTRPLALALGEVCALLGDAAGARSAFARAAEVARLWGSPHGEAAAVEGARSLPAPARA
ncbi:BTAD domain-containing putative transcriptional regulator [Streptomyces lavendulae]|uniref:BTAD domain-containing putative transcriptional regulator n=1 Tax=Streptomyces lavendulae TaxID=1914 RepID=UPI0033EBC08F